MSDDEERALLTNILSLLGNTTVTEATNEQKAFSALSGGKLDMIFLRLGHLEPDPQQVLGKIFATQSDAALFVFSAEGFSCDAFEKQAQTYGLRVAGCFAEPFSLSALAGRIVDFNPQ
ncbi:hypothetical protein ACFO5Q_01630 [Kordiimonas lipolytica]|uniref:Response regulatory domain-containing protein n=1 Tax=Kordiimonas lipolytica TaxID=1662421 RepID=A0ABV8U6S1_9PROT|nr:hypothetical protein [Kordiimonas lipolytica]